MLFFTLTFLKSMAGNCTLTPAAVMSCRSSRVDEDVDDGGDNEEHVDEASLEP